MFVFKRKYKNYIHNTYLFIASLVIVLLFWRIVSSRPKTATQKLGFRSDVSSHTPVFRLVSRLPLTADDSAARVESKCSREQYSIRVNGAAQARRGLVAQATPQSKANRRTDILEAHCCLVAVGNGEERDSWLSDSSSNWTSQTKAVASGGLVRRLAPIASRGISPLIRHLKNASNFSPFLDHRQLFSYPDEKQCLCSIAMGTVLTSTGETNKQSGHGEARYIF